MPDDLAQLLNVANSRQQVYERTCDELESLRRQLFSDWYKYMLCAYPPEDARDDYPNIDEVKSYIEANVASLNERIALTGTIAAKDTKGTDNDSGSLAGRLRQAIKDLQTAVDKHNKGLKPRSYIGKQTSGPRYWRP